MKPIKSILTAEALLLTAIAVTLIGILPRTSVPAAFVFIGGTYLLYRFFRALRTHIPLKPHFGAVSGAVFFMVLGIGLLFLPKQATLAIGIAILLTLGAQMAWIAWDSRGSH